MKLVMIGHGMVGHKFIEAVLENAGDDVGNSRFWLKSLRHGL